MPSTLLVLNHSKPNNLQTRKGKDALRRVANLVQGALSGTENVPGWLILADDTSLGTAGVATRAAAVCRMATSSGSVGAVINGTSVTVTWGTSDTASQALLVDAINANSTVKPFVRATRYLATLTLASVAAGDTVRICGLTYTATAAATSKLREFSMAGTDAQDATALANAINADPELTNKLVAVADGTNAVVYLGIVGDRAADIKRMETVTLPASTITVSDFAGRAESITYAVVPGAMGNCCTFTATGTNVTVRSAVSGKLGGGVGGLITAQVQKDDR